MAKKAHDEWDVIQRLLPFGWEDAARETGAFQRVRYTKDPASLLRLLLFHAVNDAGLRASVEQARAAGITTMTPAALHKRFRTSADWLEWIAAELCREYRDRPRLPESLRLRVIDSTTLRAPASKGTDWRLHYMLDLATLACDWHELTDGSGAEALERAPVEPTDVILGDRSFFRPRSLLAMRERGAHVVLRMRWCHGKILRANGRSFRALTAARRLRVGQVGGWSVRVAAPGHEEPISGRVIATRLPAPLARKAVKRVRDRAARQCKRVRSETIEAARFVIIFTTLPEDLLDDAGVLELYRYRWQVEVAFKRHKQLLKIGRVPHTDRDVARTWIHAKLVVALLLEKLYRSARFFSPWGYRLRAAAEPARALPA